MGLTLCPLSQPQSPTSARRVFRAEVYDQELVRNPEPLLDQSDVRLRSHSGLASGSKRSAAELMQKRWPVGAGPSSKTCPWWAPQTAQWTSVRRMKRLRSSSVSTLFSSIGCQKLGQPVPESYLVSDEKSGASHATQRYTPSSLLS